MNKAQLRARTRQLSGAELDGLRDDTEVDLLVDEAYRQIGYLVAWKWREATGTVATVVDQEEYALPTEVEEPQGVSILGATGHPLPVPLREVTLRDLLTRIDRDDSKLPRYYARTADKLRLGPAPDKVYTVEVFGLAPLVGMTLDTDEPEWASRFHAPIAYLAAAVFLDEEGQEELAEKRRLRAEELLGDMVDFYQVSKDTTPIIVGGGQDIRSTDRLGRLYPWRV